MAVVTKSAVRYSLAGIRTQSEPGGPGCTVCRSIGAPALVLLRHVPTKDLVPAARLCLPCIGRAVETATGWRVMRAWSQWLASSKVGQQLRNSRPEVISEDLE
jgi:hypothetical protein